jgi:hypothetical protein
MVPVTIWHKHSAAMNAVFCLRYKRRAKIFGALVIGLFSTPCRAINLGWSGFYKRGATEFTIDRSGISQTMVSSLGVLSTGG